MHQVASLAAARKMAKKGGQASLQVEVSSDDEWEALLERKGLVGNCLNCILYQLYIAS